MPIRLRHWKQRFNPNAVFVFAKRVRIGEAGDPWAPAGTVVDSARFAKRLKLWWDVGLIEIQDWTLGPGETGCFAFTIDRPPPLAATTSGRASKRIPRPALRGQLQPVVT